MPLPPQENDNGEASVPPASNNAARKKHQSQAEQDEEAARSSVFRRVAATSSVSQEPITATTPSSSNSSPENAIRSATTPQQQQEALASYDPFSPKRPPSAVQNSLLDDDDSISTVAMDSDAEGGGGASSRTTTPTPRATTGTVPGAAGFLEMEEEPPRTPQQYEEHPIQTSSGLLLTHRRTPAEQHYRQSRNSSSRKSDRHATLAADGPATVLFGSSNTPTLKRTQRFEVENPWSAHHHRSNSNNSLLEWQRQGQRLLSIARMWVILSATVLLLGTTVIVKHIRHETAAADALESTTLKQQDETTTASDIRFLPLPDVAANNNNVATGPIVLLPLENAQQVLRQRQQQQQQNFVYPPPLPQQFQVVPPAENNNNNNNRRRLHALLPDLLQQENLRGEFDAWCTKHGKSYASHQEREKRFQIWRDNHERTAVKNARHGPCRLTKQPVFGSNHFQDLTAAEFQSQYLTGYTGPTKDKEPTKTRNLGVLGPHVAQPNRHPAVHRRLQQAWQRVNRLRSAGSGSATARTPTRTSFMGTSCDWYDASCLLKYIFETYFYGLGKTMEPGYDSDSYPTAIDWRDMGAVTEVHSQGNCGACWAITAIETVESAMYIGTNTLYDLSETEVIVCSDECEMCAGGWPQNAFEYVMEHNGVPLESDCAYDGDFLLSLSDAKAGESDEMDEDTMKSYMNSICPNGGGSGSGSGSNDGGDNGSSNNYSRYGKISGYGYATQKCVCYTDGTGCECDSQNEGMAVRNVATYGPAVVCFDASNWQDYAGGIITANSGCSSHFMDVNHCAQVVGYAYMSDDEEDMQGGSGSNDRSGGSGGSGGSRDDGSSRTGYWIVRNQWSSYWGMNGYAYVAMGDNTCGILNDMLVAYK